MSKGRKPASAIQAAAQESELARPAGYEIKFTEDSGAEIRNLDGSVRKQLKKALEKKLAVDPEGYGLPLRGVLTNYWKHEFGSHRIIYRIYREARLVVVCAVGPRKAGDKEDIYRQLEAVATTGRLAGQLASVLKKLLP
jgi:mRNA interferase RelE/StbE